MLLVERGQCCCPWSDVLSSYPVQLHLTLELIYPLVSVCAYEFECLNELVQDNVNGRTFTTAPQLSTLLWDLLSPLNPKQSVGNHDFGELKKFSLQIQGRALWSENWPKQAKPLLESIVRGSTSS